MNNAAAPILPRHTPGKHPGPEEPLRARLLIVLSLLLAFASISTDLYLPALPAMAAALGASQGALELTISGYLLGFSIGQLFWGPISDRFGRRWPIIVGATVFIVGAAGCALANDASQIIGWRVVQAIGASAAVALARAMVRDIYDRDRAAKLLSTLMTVMAIAPLLGPLLGAQLLGLGSWRLIFWMLVAIGVVTIAGVWSLPETLPAEKREAGSLRPVLANYASLLRNKRFLAYAGAVGAFYAALFASIAGTPFAYITYHGTSPELYAVLFASGIIGLMLANFINARLVVHAGSDRLLLFGIFGAVLLGVAVAAVTVSGWGGAYGLAVALFFLTSMNGFILANAVAGALSSVPSRVGSASAVVGATQYGGGMLGSALVAFLANGTPAPMGLVMAAACSVSALCVLPVTRIGRGRAE